MHLDCQSRGNGKSLQSASSDLEIYLHDPKYQINFRLEPGDIFSFNNRRLLHGRTEFDPNSGHRHLQGYYMDRDEIIGRLNYLKQQL